MMKNIHNRLFVLVMISVLFLFLQCVNTSSNKVMIKNKNISIELNDQMQSRILYQFKGTQKALCDFLPAESISVSDRSVDAFLLADVQKENITNKIGKGIKYDIIGNADLLRKTVSFEVYPEFPTMIIVQAEYTNMGENPLQITGWTNNAYTIKTNTENLSKEAFWSFQGSSHEDRRDWIQPLSEGFYQQNYMGMNDSDYGGGTPVSDVWREDVGIAVGHVEMTPKLVSIPVSMSTANEARLSVTDQRKKILAPGESIQTLRTFVEVHQGDFFNALAEYSRFMQSQGIRMPEYKDSQYEPIWCAWGFRRDFKTEQIYAALPKAKELGFEWAVLDDGYQVAEGDWSLIKSKFPKGDASMRSFVDEIHKQGMKAKLWWTPLAVDPGTKLIKEHPEYLLLNEDGSTQDITWWNSYYLCPAYPEVQQMSKNLVIKFMKEWGFDGLKIDGQHLNAAPPCYNPAHHHADPEESVRGVAEFFKLIYETAKSINPDAVVEICPCGTMYAYHTLPYNNQPVASDPESSWQVRLKGKTFKALMGPDVSYYGDHVELTDSREDFSTTVGIGGVIGTKFTWPVGSKIGSKVDLTPEKEAHFRKWVHIYKEKMLPKGNYRGDLYDLGFDRPETHAIQKGDTLYYAFYVDAFEGAVELRGLDKKRYTVTDYVHEQPLGEVQGPKANLNVRFDNSLLIEVAPLP